MKKPNLRLDHCVIAATDLARTDAFYRDVLGAEITAPMDNFRQYRIGAHMLNVHGPGLHDIAPPDLLARQPVQPGNSDLCFEFSGTIEEAQSWLEACSINIHAGPVRREGAKGEGWSVYFRDPDGSLLELISYQPSSGPAEG